jgi:hypothetical protein
MFLKRMGRDTMLETFDEAIKLEKKMLSFKGNPRVSTKKDHEIQRSD